MFHWSNKNKNAEQVLFNPNITLWVPLFSQLHIWENWKWPTSNLTKLVNGGNTIWTQDIGLQNPAVNYSFMLEKKKHWSSKELAGKLLWFVSVHMHMFIRSRKSNGRGAYRSKRTPDTLSLLRLYYSVLLQA